MAIDTLAETSDDEPYAELTHFNTHPDLMATIGHLLGLGPAPVDRCRVLELGCAAGGNITAMAEALPGSEFVGVDYSERQIQEGREAVREMGFTNVTLHQADIRALDALELGTFDYIIAHGVYSWVPADVRDGLLAACKSLLNPAGIAYVSYNAYPGWFMMRGLRDALLYRTRELESPRDRATEAESFARLLRLAVPRSGDPFSQLLDSYEANIEGRHQAGGDRAASLLLHDELAEINEPFYFREFAEHAASHGLQYLADADFPSVFPIRFPAEVQSKLRVLARDAIELQQYIDFLTNAAFHQTLLCHGSRVLSRRIGTDMDVMRRLYVSSPAGAGAGGVNIEPGVVHRFSGSDGAVLAIDNPIAKAAMAILCERFPSRVPFPQLLADARVRLGQSQPAEQNDEAQLAAVLLQGLCYSVTLVEMRTLADPFSTTPGARPAAPLVARRRAGAGLASVTNLRHERLNLEPFQLRLVALFDGTRTREEVIDLLLRDVEQGRLAVKDGDAPAANPRALLEPAVREAVAQLAAAAMFTA
jgi:methyltransferase-like protein/2-polyprenyl-3-methyl-5-hydroxy-6-metoxy-1,4-benzoquinol methylase